MAIDLVQGPPVFAKHPIARNGGQILGAALRIHAVDRVFGVPGESYLPLLDAIYASGSALEFIVCRHEAGAANMADADAKLTGRPGVCAVSRGPGAMHAAIGVHTAQQDSTPLILLIGQVPRPHRGRQAFQEMDFKQVFGSVAKFVAEIDYPAEIPEIFAEAYRVTMTGRRGPVVLSLPEDVLAETCSIEDIPPKPLQNIEPHPQKLEMISQFLGESRRPLLILGGSGWNKISCENVLAFAEDKDIPIAAGFRCQDLVPNASDHYVGELGFGTNPALKKRVADADLLLVVGERLGDVTTQGYSLIEEPHPRQKLIHVHPGADELGRVYKAALPVHADVDSFVAALRGLAPPADIPWQAWRSDAREDYISFQNIPAAHTPLDMTSVIRYLRDRLPADAILTNGAGNYTIWIHRFYRYGGFRTQLAPVSGAMGYGIPAAIAAKLRYPERNVIAFAGDGCFTMSMTEIATAVQHGVEIVIIVVNNGMYGSIRMHQERQFPGRAIGVHLQNPDFAALAEAFGAFGETVVTTAQFAPAFDRALSAGRLAILELRVDPSIISPTVTLSGIAPDRSLL
jgi:acetolactate synthase-1/2/3 large subunit